MTDRMTVAGFGFRAQASLASLRDALAQALAHRNVSESPAGSITLIATAQDKADAACLQALAASLNLPVCAVAPEDLASMTTLTDSAPVRARRGTGSVAEAAALAAAVRVGGAGATLLHPRTVSSDRLATCAIASFTPIPGNRS
ncbi:MAG: Cobalamin synthesis [Ramlibacter sp.]|jgi:cobalt-precorrin 5A hydrolase|nr:Cobalamin synthesis [Ramlibacter sp.]